MYTADMPKRLTVADLTGQIMTPNEVAKELGLSGRRVQQLADEGALPAVRTVSGHRLYLRRDVERLKKIREKRQTN